ncbi:MAG: choice-of-anchor D domain-containing protein [Solirubrobacterales bacterium]|nr:choice-of-anchor D domain-containing protein [Solirubrobacterales bacterium]OJU96218.1 MAG: hypothetical protein BGO23_01470 [Solirubrobacterales bacterium 67-14]
MRKLTFLISLCLCAAASASGAGLAMADEPDPGPTLSISPGHFAFGPINVGAELGEPGEFTLSNPGPEPVQLDDAILEGPDPFSFKILPNGSSCYFLEPAGLIPAGTSCTVVTIFDPESEGPKQASLKITSDSVTSPDVMPLTGTGLARLLPGAALAPQAGDFGSQLLDQASAPVSFALKSTGTGDLGIESVGLDGSDRDQFNLVRNGCTQVAMASGDSCSIEVVFAPTSAGPKSASLTVQTDAEGADTAVELTGMGISEPDPEPSSRVEIGRLPRLRGAKSQMVRINCIVVEMDGCRGRVTLRARGRDLGLKHRRQVRIGTRAYSLDPGRGIVRVKLGSRARRAVRRVGRLGVQVLASSRQADGRLRTVKRGRSVRR